MLLVLKPYPGGNIGNYLFHLCHGVMWAQLREATLVVPRPLALRSLNRSAVALDFSSGSRSYDPGKVEVLEAFIHGNELTRQLSFRYRYFCMQDHVRPLFDDAATHDELDDNTLAIHVRSGDIFGDARINPKYGQPPLSWYETLIERSGFASFVVVTQTRFAKGRLNPVVAAIRERWPEVRILSEDTECDFHTLRHARHLALSVGTFALTAAMCNVQLESLHVPRYDRTWDPNFSDIFPAGEDLGFTRVDYEIGGYAAMHSWENRPDQVELMLGHAARHIRATREG